MNEECTWVEEKACPLCGSKRINFYDYGFMPILRFPGFFGGVPMAMMTSYSECECGLIFQNPHMSKEYIVGFYLSGLYRQMVNTNDPASMDADENAGQIKNADLVPVGKHLDVGCSHGLILELTRMKGCEILGVEPNRDYVNPGVPSVGSLYEVTGEWDTITCFHVLEHVPDLQPFVNKLIELIRPGGALILEVPADGTNGGKLRLAHLYQFTDAVIRKLFASLTVEKYELNPHHFYVMRKP